MTRREVASPGTKTASPEQVADILAVVLAQLDAGDLDTSKQGRAFLAGAEAACRAMVNS